METNETTQPMDRENAELLDKHICEIINYARDHLADISDLLANAKAGQIHKALGFPSWPAYLADRLKPLAAVLSDQDRRELVTHLYEAGMSVRDTAEAVGMSKSAVHRQVSRDGTVADETIGHTNKTYRRQRTGTKTTRRQSITRTARDLLKIAKRFEELGTNNRLAKLDALDLMVIGDQLLEANATVHAAWLAVEELT